MHVGVAVVGAAVAVFARRAAELGHGHHRHILHAVAQVLVKRRERSAEIGQVVCQLPLDRVLRRLIYMRVPPSDIGERDLQPNIRLHQARDLLQALAEAPVRILGAAGRRVALFLD